MIYSRSATAALICFSVSLGGGAMPVRAQATDASDSFEQGVEAFQEGRIADAVAALDAVDADQLDAQQQARYLQIRTDIAQMQGLEPAELVPAESGGTGVPSVNGEAAGPTPTAPAEDAQKTPSELLYDADLAATRGDEARARSLYAQVIESAGEDASSRETAKVRLRYLDQMATQDPTAAVQSLLDAATNDIRMGDLAAARDKYNRIQAMDSDLGWWEADQLKQIGQVLAIREAGSATPTASTDSTEPGETTAPDTADVRDPITSAPVVGTNVESSAPAGPPMDVFAQAAQDVTNDRLALAQEARSQGQLDLAKRYLEQAQALDAQNPQIEAERRLIAQAEADQTPEMERPNIGVDQAAAISDVIRQRVITQYEAAMERAQQQLAAGNFDQALAAIDDAKGIAQREVNRLGPPTFEAFMSRSDSLAAATLTAQNAQRERDLVNQIKSTGGEVANDNETAMQNRERQVQDLLIQGRQLQRDMRYEEALQLIDRALFMEPLNFAAQAMRDMTIDAMQLRRAQGLHDLRNEKLMEQRLNNMEGIIPYEELLTYPESWPEITRTRLLGLQGEKQESEQTRQARLKLQDTIQINVDNARLDNVIEYLRKVTTLNITVNWNALAAVGVAQDTPISLNLSNVRAEQALRLVLQQAGAGSFDPIGFSINDGIIELSTQADLKRTVETRVYDIRDLLVQVPNFEDAPPFDLNQALSNTGSGGSTESSRGGGNNNNNSGGGGGGGGNGGGGIFGNTGTAAGAPAGPSRQDIVEQIRTLVTTTIGDTNEWLENQSTLQELNGNLIVKSTPDNHREVLSLLAQLRETRAIQISVEARFLLVDESFLEDIGVDLDINIADPGGKFGPITIAQDSATIASPVENSFGEGGAFPGGSFVPGLGFSPSLRALDFGASFIDDISVNLLIRATQANRRSISLTAPRVTFFNGQRAYVLIARQVAFISDLEPVPDTGGFDVTVSVTNSGVVLDVEGVISADRRYVTLTLRPSLGNVLRPIRQVPVNNITAIGDGNLGGVVDPTLPIDPDVQVVTGFVEVPELQITTVRCTVSVPDKGTLLIGGQRIVGETETEAGVPVLSKIPVLNRLFNNRSLSKDERTLLILVKPTIIIQSELEEQNFPGLLDDPLNYNVGERF